MKYFVNNFFCKSLHTYMQQNHISQKNNQISIQRFQLKILFSHQVQTKFLFYFTKLKKLSSCTMHTAHCTMHNAQCTLHNAHCIMHIAQCTLHNPHCTRHIAQCTLHNPHCTMHIAQCTLHNAHCTMHVIKHVPTHAPEDADKIPRVSVDEIIPNYIQLSNK